MIISLDLELHWGVRDHRTVSDYGANLAGVRPAVEGILKLFESREIHATWATVGLLFCDGADDALSIAPPPALRPHYRRTELDPYTELASAGRSERDDPFHFAPALIERIARTPGQEIATHTFSHFYCLEAGPTMATFRADLEAAKRVAARKGISLESIVFPRNQTSAAHVAVARELGLRSYRGNPRSLIYAPRASADDTWLVRGARLLDSYVPLTRALGGRPEADSGLINVPASRFLRPIGAHAHPALETLRVRRVLKEMRDAAAAGRDYHLWWHPHNFGLRTDDHLALLETVVDHHRVLRRLYGTESRTMAERARAFREAA